MAGLPGKTAFIAGAKQTAKGTIAATPVYRNAFSGGNIAPVRNTDRLTETDSARDQGAAYVTSSGVEGSPELYVRDDALGFYLMGVLGADAASGTTNFTHTMTPGQTLPYYTFWRNVGGSSGVYESFQDCWVPALTVAADAGSALTATATIIGLKPTYLVADPGGPALNTGQVYTYNDLGAIQGGSVSLGGSTVHNIRSFSLTIDNNASTQQTDDYLPYDNVIGQREISLSFDVIFESPAEYRAFHYGVGGTAVTPNIYTTSAVFTFNHGTNNSVAFNLPSIAYEEYSVDPSPGGDPIVVSVRAVAQKATGVPNLLTAILKNQVATY